MLRFWRSPGFALTIILILATVLRLINLDHSYWIDEILSFEASTGTLLDIAKHTYSPLSYLLSYFTLKLGYSESLLRLPSFLAGCYAPYALYRLLKTLHSTGAGLVAALLLAISVFHINHSQDGRYYSLMALASILTIHSFFLAFTRGSQKDYLVFGLVATISCLIHPFYLPYLASVLFTGFAYHFLSSSQRLLGPKRLFITAGVTACALIPVSALYIYHKLLNSGLTIAVRQRPSSRYVLSLSEYFGLQKQQLDLGLTTTPNEMAMALLVICLLAAGLLTAWKHRTLIAGLAFSAIILMPIPLLFLPVSHWYLAKYFITQLPFYIMIMSVGAIHLPTIVNKAVTALRKSRETREGMSASLATRILPGFALALFALFKVDPLSIYYLEEQDRYRWKEMAASIANYSTSDDLLLFYTSEYGDQRYYPFPAHEPKPKNLDFYMRRAVPHGQVGLYNYRQAGIGTSDELTSYVLSNTTSTIWLVQEYVYPSVHLTKAQSELFKIVQRSPNLALRVLARPTTNYVANGGLETSAPVKLQNGAHVTSTNSYAGSKCLNLPAGDGSMVPVAFFGTTTTSASLSAANLALSAVVSYTGIHNHPDKGEGYIAVNGKRTDGQPYRRVLASFRGTRDWHLRAFLLGNDPELDLNALDSFSIEFGITGNMGTLCVDNVQLELENSPSPFVDGVRLPHDQSLAWFNQ